MCDTFALVVTLRYIRLTRWDTIQNNPERPWNWDGISYNKNITWEIIQANPERPWNWGNISFNPNITWEIIQDNPDKEWVWFNISQNKMNKGRERWIDNLRLRIIKALQIQRHWRNCSCNLEYRLARKLIKAKLDD